jgi:cellulose synthase/poly-beta-1,6-N-acetylglucosamine synthase-like glycosyltransferase
VHRLDESLVSCCLLFVQALEKSWKKGNSMLTISIVVVAYNEEKTLPQICLDLNVQTYPHSLIDILFVDSASEDATKTLMTEYGRQENGFNRVAILDNPRKILPCGWNVALENVQTDVVLRIDAHATIPPDFIQNNIQCLETGENVCGGYRPNIIDKNTRWNQLLLTIESSLFGSSPADYRRNGKKRYVTSIFHGAYRKSVFDTVGMYDERLARTEDNDMHYRMRKAGFLICFDPQIVSYEHTRNSLKKMVRQKYLNGKWVGLTLWIQPHCFSLFHFVPLVFVCMLFFFGLASFFSSLYFVLLICLYAATTFVMSIASAISSRQLLGLVVFPFLFFLLHVSYGLGTLVGFFCKSQVIKK